MKAPSFGGESTARLRPWARTGLGLLISLVCIILVVRDLEWPDVVAAFGRANFWWLIPALGALALTILAKAWRWALLFRPHHRPRPITLSAGILVGQMVNNALPVRLGEVARIQYLHETDRIPRSFTLGTIALEKALDSVSLLALFVLVVPFALLPEWVRQSGLLVTAGIGLALTAGILVVSRRGSLTVLAETLVARLSVLHRFASSRRVATILSSLDVLGHAGLLAQALLHSALALIAGAAVNGFVLLALGLDFSVPAALFVLLIGYLGGTVPASPGRIGVFQWLTILSLTPFGVDQPVAFSYSLVLYVVVIVVPTLAGVVVIARRPLRLGGDSATAADQPVGEVAARR